MKKTTKKILSFLCVLAMVVSMLPLDHAQAASVQKVSLNYKSVVMKKGSKLTLKATVTPGKKKVTWKSSKKKIVSVSAKGVVKAKKKGVATITAKAGKKKATCKITVGIPVSKVVVDQTTLSMQVSEAKQLTASVQPANATVKTLSYKSSDPSVATVNGAGMISAVKEGTAKITVTSKDGNGKKAVVTVNVASAGQPNNLVPPTQVPPTEVPDTNPVTGITLSSEEEYVGIGAKVTLQAKLTPDNPSIPTITWASEDPKIATVDASGVVTGVSKGTTTITATTKSGNFVAKCLIHSGNVYRVATQEQLDAALEDSADYLIVTGDQAMSLTIPKGSYADTTLIVDAPKAEVSNKGTFKQILVKQIAPDTFHEYANGNEMSLMASKSHIVVEKDANVTINIQQGTGEVNVENNGTVKRMNVNVDAKISVSGEATDVIPVYINAAAQVSTNQNLQIEAIVKFSIDILSGAENTTVSVNTKANVPTITGLGMISVTIQETGDVDTIISNNPGMTLGGVKVSFTGTVNDVDEQPIADAKVILVPYIENYDISKIAEDPSKVEMTTNAEGKYATDSIMTGNYILVASKDEYMTVQQNLVITSTYGEIYTNEEINLLPASYEGKTGGVSGTIKEAQNGTTLADMTIRVRKNKNNLLGDSMTEFDTKTDASGMFTIENLPAGYYTIQVLDQRADVEVDKTYMSLFFNVLVRPDTMTTGQGGTMTLPVAKSQVRFVLTWGSKEDGAISDADSHLIGPAGSGIGVFHTYYMDKTYSYNDEKYADLDVDDTDYKGPETTTIYKEVKGVYHFYVHDYTNGGTEPCSRLSASKVYVNVYSGSHLLATYYVPDQEGTLWHVCDYDSATGSLTTVNTMSYEHCDTSEIGLTKQQIAMQEAYKNLERTKEYLDLYEGTEKAALEEKLNAIQEKMASAQTEEEMESASKEAEELYDSLSSDSLYVTVTGDNVLGYGSLAYTNKLYVRVSDETTPYEVKFSSVKSSQEVTPQDPLAAKAYQVTLESGWTRTIQVYLQREYKPTKVMIGDSPALSYEIDTDWDYDEEDDEYVINILRIYDTAEEVTTDNLKVYSGTVAATITQNADGTLMAKFGNGEEAAKYQIRYTKWNIPELEDPDNEIYGMKLDGYDDDEICIFGKNATLSENAVWNMSGGYTCRVRDREDRDYGEYMTVQVYDEDEDSTSYDVYYYCMDKYLNLSYVSYGGTDYDECDAFYSSIDHDACVVTVGGITVTQASQLSPETRYSWGGVSLQSSVEMVSGQDYIALITVKATGLDQEFTKTYKVYQGALQDDEDEDYDEDEEDDDYDEDEDEEV